MSIVIDTDLTTLMSKLNISAAKMQQEYALMTIEEIVEAEAEAGNQAAVKYATELFQSPDMLVKIFIVFIHQEYFIHSPRRIQKHLCICQDVINEMPNSQIRQTYHCGNCLLSEFRRIIDEGFSSK